jgi:hypothetical protein
VIVVWECPASNGYSEYRRIIRSKRAVSAYIRQGFKRTCRAPEFLQTNPATTLMAITTLQSPYPCFSAKRGRYAKPQSGSLSHRLQSLQKLFYIYGLAICESVRHSQKTNNEAEKDLEELSYLRGLFLLCRINICDQAGLTHSSMLSPARRAFMTRPNLYRHRL